MRKRHLAISAKKPEDYMTACCSLPDGSPNPVGLIAGKIRRAFIANHATN
jgi:hypothetical protein